MSIVAMINISNKDDQADPDLRYMVERLLSEIGIEGKLSEHFNTICATYHQYLNSDNKVTRMEQLLSLANAAKLMRNTIGGAFKDRPIPNKVSRTINHLCQPRLANYYLNWQQICQFFFYCESVVKADADAGNRPQPTAQEIYELKMAHLTALYRVLIDLEEVALVTNAEPDYEVQT